MWRYEIPACFVHEKSEKTGWTVLCKNDETRTTIWKLFEESIMTGALSFLLTKKNRLWNCPSRVSNCITFYPSRVQIFIIPCTRRVPVFIAATIIVYPSRSNVSFSVHFYRLPCSFVCNTTILPHTISVVSHAHTMRSVSIRSEKIK